MTETPVLETRDVCKSFIGLDAVSCLSMQIWPGEAVCLLGHNGAGKSTLIKLLSGVLTPTSGTILVDGQVVRFGGPRQARMLGIATVHQDAGVIPFMSIARNFCLGAEPMRNWGPLRWFDVTKARNNALEQMRRLGIVAIQNANQLAETLSGGERRALAIARAIYYGARVLIFDEATSDLGVRESESVLQLIAQVRDEGVAVIFVTHNAQHALTVGDRFLVLIRGRCAATFRRRELTPGQLLSLMAGGDEMNSLEVELELASDE